MLHFNQSIAKHYTNRNHFLINKVAIFFFILKNQKPWFVPSTCIIMLLKETQNIIGILKYFGFFQKLTGIQVEVFLLTENIRKVSAKIYNHFWRIVTFQPTKDVLFTNSSSHHWVVKNYWLDSIRTTSKQIKISKTDQTHFVWRIKPSFYGNKQRANKQGIVLSSFSCCALCNSCPCRQDRYQNLVETLFFQFLLCFKFLFLSDIFCRDVINYKT